MRLCRGVTILRIFLPHMRLRSLGFPDMTAMKQLLLYITRISFVRVQSGLGFLHQEIKGVYAGRMQKRRADSFRFLYW